MSALRDYQSFPLVGVFLPAPSSWDRLADPFIGVLLPGTPPDARIGKGSSKKVLG